MLLNDGSNRILEKMVHISNLIPANILLHRLIDTNTAAW